MTRLDTTLSMNEHSVYVITGMERLPLCPFCSCSVSLKISTHQVSLNTTTFSSGEKTNMLMTLQLLKQRANTLCTDK
jgi:hypothetical protein